MTTWTTFLIAVGVATLVGKLFRLIDWIEEDRKHE